MPRPWWLKPAPAPRRRPAAARPRLLRLEDRLAPATLDFSAGALTFTAAGPVALTLSRSGGRYAFTEPSGPQDPIVVTPPAAAVRHAARPPGSAAARPAGAGHR